MSLWPTEDFFFFFFLAAILQVTAWTNWQPGWAAATHTLTALGPSAFIHVHHRRDSARWKSWTFLRFSPQDAPAIQENRPAIQFAKVHCRSSRRRKRFPDRRSLEHVNRWSNNKMIHRQQKRSAVITVLHTFVLHLQSLNVKDRFSSVVSCSPMSDFCRSFNAARWFVVVSYKLANNPKKFHGNSLLAMPL